MISQKNNIEDTIINLSKLVLPFLIKKPDFQILS